MCIHIIICTFNNVPAAFVDIIIHNTIIIIIMTFVGTNETGERVRETSSYVVIMTNSSFTYIYNNIIIIIPSVHCYQNTLCVMYVCWPPPACDNPSEPPDLPVIIFNEVIYGMWLNLKRVVRARYDCQGWLTRVIVTAMRARGGRLRRTGYA